jgi:hypothetical protein
VASASGGAGAGGAPPPPPFVAGFVGAGRTLRRLDLLSAAEALAAPGPAAGEGPVVSSTATLADVLAALLTSDAPAVRVVDGGASVGVVTLDSIRGAIRGDGPP